MHRLLQYILNPLERKSKSGLTQKKVRRKGFFKDPCYGGETERKQKKGTFTGKERAEFEPYIKKNDSGKYAKKEFKGEGDPRGAEKAELRYREVKGKLLTQVSRTPAFDGSHQGP